MLTEELFRTLLTRTEKVLITLGIWPSSWNWWVTVFNIIVLFGYSILVLYKNLNNPEGESIENAFTLANGGLLTVVYFVTMLMKKEKCEELCEFIKTEHKIATTKEEKEIIIKVANEFQRISTAFLYFLPPAIMVRFLMPTTEYFYIKCFTENKTFELPPAMGLPVDLFGEIPIYIIESFVRAHMLITVMGVSIAFIISSLAICTQLYILANQLENLKTEDQKTVENFIHEHRKLIGMAKILNDIFSPYFFADCLLSFINLSIMMFSFLAHNARIGNYLSEMPLVICGTAQLFFLLYFGDRLIEATEELSMAAYKSEWYGKSVKHQKKILFIIMRAQRPQTISIGNRFMIASVLLFSQILQRAWGGFNLLRTIVR